jgi:hypothetical protein
MRAEAGAADCHTSAMQESLPNMKKQTRKLKQPTAKG